MIEAAANGNLPEYVSDAFPNSDSYWADIVADAAAAHRAGIIDVVAAFAHASEERLAFGCQQFLQDVLPMLVFDQSQVLELVVGLSEQSRGQGIPYYLSAWFSSWCEAKASRPWALLEAINTGSAPDYIRHSVCHSGLKVSRRRFLPALIRMAKNGSDDERWSATNLLGRFDGFHAHELDRAIQALRAAIRREKGAAVVAPLRSLLHVAANIAGKESEGVAAIADRSNSNDEHVRNAIASEMMFSISKAPEPLANAAFQALMAIGPGEDDTIDVVDQILSKTMAGQLAPAAHALLDHLLMSRSARMKKLDATATAILNSAPVSRSALIGTWLRSPSFRHFDAILEISSGVGENTPTFEIDMSAWSPEEALRAIRRSSAILLAFPGTLASILVSALRTAPISVRNQAEHLIFDPLLMTFWVVSRAYLERAVNSGPRHARDAIHRVLAAHDAYQAAIEAAYEIKELAPSEHHRTLVEQKHREERRAISKNAMKGSIFGEIFPTSVMLYGDAAVYDVYQSEDESVRQETQMVSQGFSTEVLRFDMVEPFWARYRRDMLLRDETDE
ncbi:hypothetical protein [Sphingopyxis granuli]|uniref:Uncharacterized protein n=1 Tax=Sphingopyxis granuli TaxID=267128 RepID=A0AA86GU31_9SPHN|nr:hypothetical protein [Sphingopyxis granuli]AMG75558.1 Uncharacterized protein SGRAN_3215 [Sphingopyxis granuli]